MSDLVEQCPLPELAEALRPYIKPREEVAEIRRGIDSLLNQYVDDQNIPISRVTLPTTGTSAQSALNTPFNGVRRAFMQALIARQKAQSQYDALKAELDLLQHTPSDKENDEKQENPVAETVALIRQRQRRDRLLVIEKALDNLEKVRHNSRYADPSELLNNMQSQIPPPLAQHSQDDSLADAQSHVFELQKAVLRAQSSIQSKSHTNTPQQPITEDWKRAYALRKARDELIAWIEDELSKLSENEETMHSDMDVSGDSGLESLDGIKSTLQELYSRYITSREHLVRVLNTQVKPNSDSDKPVLERQQSANDNDESIDAGLASKVLPYIGILRSTVQEEAALMQHTSYLRRQITAASAETEQLLVRLSDESHMVRPGTSHTAAWAEAARDTRDSDKDVVHSHLFKGKTSIGSVGEFLASA
ncbi:hypothetical protein QM012_008787 [Aureobasidium pullulans]|uniref:Uncharacterized protein n=1 Tax=Aureobasidium pullulans TaxID=5580 RepID=A0ABR0TIG8_AURPU